MSSRGIKDIVVTTPDELNEEREIIGSLLERAVREGKILYDRRKSDSQDPGLAALRTGGSAGRHENAGSRT